VSQTRANVPPAIRRRIEAQMFRIARRHGVWVSQMLDPKQKPQHLVRPRVELIAWLRQEVYGYRGREPRTTTMALRSEVDGQRGWHPLSYPIIGSILGLDHSTILLAQKRQREARRQLALAG